MNEFVAKCWFVLVIGCGFLALFLFISSVKNIWKKRHMRGLILAASELVSARVSVSAWMWALGSSGKPRDMFGFGYCAPMAIICICMFAAGAVCIILNALCIILNSWRLAKQKAACEGVTEA